MEKERTIKKHHIWGVIGIIIGILLTVLIMASLGYKYTNYVKKQSYILGGKDALDNLVTIIDYNGGIVIEQGNKKMVLARYTKEISEEIDLRKIKEAVENKTNQTINNSNEIELEEPINYTEETVEEVDLNETV